LAVTDIAYYNFNILPFPLDKAFPGLSVRISRGLERFCRGRMRRLGTGFIVKARKPA